MSFARARALEVLNKGATVSPGAALRTTATLHVNI